MSSLSRGRVERRCHFTVLPNAKINTAIFSQLFLFHVRSGPKTETFLIPFAEKEDVGRGGRGTVYVRPWSFLPLCTRS
jgi:hypothetical protein